MANCSCVPSCSMFTPSLPCIDFTMFAMLSALLLIITKSSPTTETARSAALPVTISITWSMIGCPDENFTRSEEHTSELQSRGHLVCRLLLEKKNITRKFFIDHRDGWYN